MKKNSFLLKTILISMIFCLCFSFVAAAATISLTIGAPTAFVDGKEVTIDVAPEATAGVTFVPVRFITENLGITNNWNAAAPKDVVLTKEGFNAKIVIGSTEASINGAAKTLLAAPYVKDGRTMVPIRFLSENLGYNVGYDPATQRITITSADSANSSSPTKPILSSDQIAELCSPAVFYVESYALNGELGCIGSGFFISADGLAITNYLVVQNSLDITITMDNGSVFNNVKIIDADKKNDIALLKVEGNNFPYIEFGDSSALIQGQRVLAIGHTWGLSTVLSERTITNTNSEDYFQISKQDSFDFCNGVLINEYGEAIGIASVAVATTDDYNFAIPINTAKALDFNSTKNLIIYGPATYPDFDSALNFEAFTGVKLLAIASTPLSYSFVYDRTDFHNLNKYDADERYKLALYYYGAALKKRGFNHIIAEGLEGLTGLFLTDTESVRISSDTENIYIEVEYIAPTYQDFYCDVPDFGWFAGLTEVASQNGQDSNNGVPYEYKMYEYKWTDFYNKYTIETIINEYLAVLEEHEYEYKGGILEYDCTTIRTSNASLNTVVGLSIFTNGALVVTYIKY